MLSKGRSLERCHLSDIALLQWPEVVVSRKPYSYAHRTPKFAPSGFARVAVPCLLSGLSVQGGPCSYVSNGSKITRQVSLTIVVQACR